MQLPEQQIVDRNGLVDILAHFGAWGEAPGVIGMALKGTLVCFRFYRWAGVSGWDVEWLLLQYGIRLCGRSFDKNSLSFLVPKHLANWAEYVMHRNNIPLLGKPVNPANRRAAGKGKIPSWNKPLHPRGLVGDICSLLDSLF